MSNIVLLIVVVLACFSTESAAQVHCVDPIEINELRVMMRTKLCLNIYGIDGRGRIQTSSCDGHDDQQLIMCGDGTIRNTASPHYCITPGSDGDADGKGYLRSRPCEVYPTIPAYQKWRADAPQSFVDNGGIEQVAYRYINEESDECMDIHGRDGSGDFKTYRCENSADDKHFYLRSRGELLVHGRLQVEESNYCLDVEGTNGRGNLLLDSCQNGDDQYFNFYENGELVNTKSGLCVDVEGTDGTGDIAMNACEDLPDQMWTLPHQYCNGDYCSFVNEESGHCLNVVGMDATRGSDVTTHRCVGAPDQRFKWVTEQWVTPTATWFMVGCNQNGPITRQVSNAISYREERSVTSTIEISSTISAEFKFGSASVTGTISSSLGTYWEHSQSLTDTKIVTCEIYDDGRPFIRGCMWQLQLATKLATNDNILTWSALIVKCTASTAVPQCPPFTKCADDACTMCEEMPDSRKKRSVDESLTWKKVLKID